VPRDLRPQLGSWVFGCDVCQEVCPWNRAAPETREPAFAGTVERAWPELTELLTLDEAGFRARFGASALRRTRRRGLARNAALALGNRLADTEQGGAPVAPSERKAAAAALVTALADPEPVVRGAAAWAIAQSRLAEARDALSAALLREADASVREELDDALARLGALGKAQAASRPSDPPAWP
jgi:epoxyqueuosine reductase